jgi:hypothetical protein
MQALFSTPSAIGSTARAKAGELGLQVQRRLLLRQDHSLRRLQQSLFVCIRLLSNASQAELEALVVELQQAVDRRVLMWFMC